MFSHFFNRGEQKPPTQTIQCPSFSDVGVLFVGSASWDMCRALWQDDDAENRHFFYNSPDVPGLFFVKYYNTVAHSKTPFYRRCAYLPPKEGSQGQVWGAPFVIGFMTVIPDGPKKEETIAQAFSSFAIPDVQCKRRFVVDCCNVVSQDSFSAHVLVKNAWDYEKTGLPSLEHRWEMIKTLLPEPIPQNWGEAFIRTAVFSVQEKADMLESLAQRLGATRVGITDDKNKRYHVYILSRISIEYIFYCQQNEETLTDFVKKACSKVEPYACNRHIIVQSPEIIETPLARLLKKEYCEKKAVGVYVSIPKAVYTLREFREASGLVDPLLDKLFDEKDWGNEPLTSAKESDQEYDIVQIGSDSESESKMPETVFDQRDDKQTTDVEQGRQHTNPIPIQDEELEAPVLVPGSQSITPEEQITSVDAPVQQENREAEKEPQKEAELEKEPQKEAELEKEPQREAELEKEPQKEAELEKEPQKEAELEKEPQEIVQQNIQVQQEDITQEETDEETTSVTDMEPTKESHILKHLDVPESVPVISPEQEIVSTPPAMVENESLIGPTGSVVEHLPLEVAPPVKKRKRTPRVVPPRTMTLRSESRNTRR